MGNLSDPFNRPIRVLEILEATTGGTRRHLYYLLTHLDTGRFSVSLVYSDLRDPHFAKDLETFAARGIELIEVPMRREISPFDDLASFLRIARIIHRGRFDIVHAHSSKAGFLGRLAARLLGVPAVIYSPHSFAFQYNPNGLRGTLYRSLERFGGKFHHKMLCVSEGEKKVACENRICPLKTLHTLCNTIPRETMKAVRLPAEVRRSLGIPESCPIVGTVAQFRPQKGLSHFVNAMPGILERCPDVRFLIVGDGPLFGEIREQIRGMGLDKRAILAGHQEHPPDFYQVMDVFVSSSLWEGMPYVILEAMAMGLPIVATDTVGNNELVTHEKNGLLVPPENPSAIADAVGDVLCDSDRRIRYTHESRYMASNLPTLQEWIARYEEFYRSNCPSMSLKVGSTRLT
jgi:glycosyltransferase involved in cell wall biosynthesis